MWSGNKATEVCVERDVDRDEVGTETQKLRGYECCELQVGAYLPRAVRFEHHTATVTVPA